MRLVYATANGVAVFVFAYREPKAFSLLIEKLVESSIAYLVAQLQAGVDAVQLFDTWAGVLPPEEFQKWCIEPAEKIVNGVRKIVPDAKIIGFPRGVSDLLPDYAAQVKVNAISVDWTANRKQLATTIDKSIALQGNLDPLALLAGGDALDHAIDAIMNDFSGRPFIFNLGHGILPPTPISHVERMIARVRGVMANF